MTGRRLSKDGERRVVKTYASPSTKQTWKNEAENEELSLSRYLHNLIQEARVLREQGRLKLGDRRHVEELQQQVDELETELDRKRQGRADPSTTSIITREILGQLLTGNFKPLDQVLKELVADETFQNQLRTELKTELYRLANDGAAEYRRGKGWKTTGSGNGGGQ